MSRVLRGAALVAATATLALLSGLPAAVAEPAAEGRYTCVNGPYEWEGTTSGTGCHGYGPHIGPGVIRFERDGAYRCGRIERIRPSADGSFSVTGTGCFPWAAE